jgi:phosphatidate cytidylyltransferase
MLDSLRKRLIPGVSFALIIGGAIYFTAWSFAIIIMLIILFCTREFFNIIQSLRDDEDVLAPYHGYMVTTLICLIFLGGFCQEIGWLTNRWLCLLPLTFLFILFWELFSKSSKPLLNIGLNIIGLLYIGMPMFMTNYIAVINKTSTGSLNYDGSLLLGALLLVMLNDVGAYFMGNWFGKRPLFSRISPKKTIEGTIGGYLVTMVGGLLGFYIIKKMPLLDWLVVSILASTGAIIGDLVESLFKRSLQIKDSGSAIPGHGGFLDRFDAILYSLPIIAAYFILRFQ